MRTKNCGALFLLTCIARQGGEPDLPLEYGHTVESKYCINEIQRAQRSLSPRPVLSFMNDETVSLRMYDCQDSVWTQTTNRWGHFLDEAAD